MSIWFPLLGMTCTSGSQTMNYRVLVSSSPDTTSNYDRAHIDFRLDTGFSDRNATNESSSRIFPSPEIADIGSNAIMYLYNYNLSTQSSILQLLSANRHNSNTSNSEIGGFAHTVSQSCNGIRFFIIVETFQLVRLRFTGVCKMGNEFGYIPEAPDTKFWKQ